jgi:DNA-binding CsgD family transcriptional regulator
MSLRANEGYRALTEKEKQTLRLIARGHDAKSSARSLGLSVHTINERLREARRKMAVSSSREAARLLLHAETVDSVSPTPELSGDIEFGDDESRPRTNQEKASPMSGVRPSHRRLLIISGVLLMILALGLSALMFSAQLAAPPTAPQAAPATAPSEAADTARQFLALLDEGRWDESYERTSASFQQSNTLQVWTDVSEETRAPLGAAESRVFVSQENLPAPPDGYEVVKFQTRFAKKPAALETVSLRRENGRWVVAGVIIT